MNAVDMSDESPFSHYDEPLFSRQWWRESLMTHLGEQEIPSAEAGERPPAEGRYPGVSLQSGAKVPHWPDEASQRAEGRLQQRGIQLPWHYGDRFGEDFRAVGLRAGGIGAVLLVESTRFREKRLYAAKTLQYFLREDYLSLAAPVREKFALAFLEEALPWLEMGQLPGIVPVQLLQNVAHPETQRKLPFVFSWFMEQGSLKDRLGKEGRLELKEALGLGVQLCEGLLHAYRHGLLAHRDLKPDNVMVYQEGIYQVTDFSAGVIGTPGYMAPEQVIDFWKDSRRRGVELVPWEIPIDQRADQFALAIVLLEALCGKHPFPIAREACGRSEERAREFVERGVGEVPDGLVPESLRKIVARALSPRPEGRFPGFFTFRESLLAAYQVEIGEPYQSPDIEIDDSWVWLFNRGRAFYQMGRPSSAEGPLKEALRRLRAFPGTEIAQARCLMNLGNIYSDTGQLLQAEYNYKDALGLFRFTPGTEIDQARCLGCLGNVHRNIGQFFQAEAHLRKALEAFRAIPGTEIDQARCLMNLGNIYNDTGQFPQAEAHLRGALGLFRSTPGTEIDQARCLGCLGNAHRNIGQFPPAETHLREALEAFRAIPGTEIDRARCIMNLGNIYNDAGQFPQAEAHLREALEAFRAIPGTEIDQADCLANMGILYKQIKEFAQAWQMLEVALEICNQYPGPTWEIKNICLRILRQLISEGKSARPEGMESQRDQTALDFCQSDTA